MSHTLRNRIPVIDLFAGPGGLAEKRPSDFGAAS